MQQLDPKAIWLFYFWHIPLAIVIAITLAPIIGFILSPFFIFLSLILANIIASVGFVIIYITTIIILPYILARLSYHFYKYELTDNGFRKEQGIIWKRYVTIPYERIQNVDIYRGVLTRILKLSDLHIQTAGFSGAGRYGNSAEGRLPGLSMETAEQLRNELIQRASHSKNQGF